MDCFNTSRRNFMKTTTLAAGLAVLTQVASVLGAHTGVDETLTVGLVGCGGRGTGAVLNALAADSQSKLVAVGDVFRDRIDSCLAELRSAPKLGQRVAVDNELIFTDFDNYKGVIDNVDVVILATPPHFRPQHLRYAIEQGKHVFAEKPVAVDAPGVRDVMQSCQLAREKRLSIVSGFCWRYDSGVRQTVQQVVEEKAIGDIVAIESCYNSGTLWHRGDSDTWSRMEQQIRNWLYYTWLSGDHIVEQAVHSLDKTAWLLGEIEPASATAQGGRQQRVDAKWGNVYDHFCVFYDYPTGQKVFFTCRQQDNTTTKVEELVLGTSGRAEILRHQLYDQSGKQTWKYRGPKPSMYQVEHDELFKSIRGGSPINDGPAMCHSTMLAIMGRMAAYSGRTMSWDECFNSEERLGPKNYEWSEAIEPNIVIPGSVEGVPR
jgi:predicted dehydrogenase